MDKDVINAANEGGKENETGHYACQVANQGRKTRPDDLAYFHVNSLEVLNKPNARILHILVLGCHRVRQDVDDLDLGKLLTMT